MALPDRQIWRDQYLNFKYVEVLRGADAARNDDVARLCISHVNEYNGTDTTRHKLQAGRPWCFLTESTDQYIAVP